MEIKWSVFTPISRRLAGNDCYNVQTTGVILNNYLHPPGDGDDDDPDQDHEEPQLLVRLLHCGEEALQPGEMAHKLPG